MEGDEHPAAADVPAATRQVQQHSLKHWADSVKCDDRGGQFRSKLTVLRPRTTSRMGSGATGGMLPACCCRRCPALLPAAASLPPHSCNRNLQGVARQGKHFAAQLTASGGSGGGGGTASPPHRRASGRCPRLHMRLEVKQGMQGLAAARRRAPPSRVRRACRARGLPACCCVLLGGSQTIGQRDAANGPAGGQAAPARAEECSGCAQLLEMALGAIDLGALGH